MSINTWSYSIKALEKLTYSLPSTSLAKTTTPILRVNYDGERANPQTIYYGVFRLSPLLLLFNIYTKPPDEISSFVVDIHLYISTLM